MTAHRYELYTRSGSPPFARTGISRSYTRLDYTKRYQANGDFSLSIPEEAPELSRIVPGNIIEVTRDGLTDFFGYVTNGHRIWDEKYPASAIASLKGQDLTAWVLRHRVAVPPTSFVQYYGNQGTGEEVAKQALLDHFINPVDLARQFPSLQNAPLTSPPIGGLVTINLHGEKWDAAMANIALAGDIGYRIWLRDDLGGILEFQTYLGSDRSGSVTFNPAYRNLRQFTYDLNLDVLENHVYTIGGSDPSTDRFVVEDENAASVALWGRYEALQDGRNAYNAEIAHTEAAVYLAPRALPQQLSFQPADVSQVQYLTDWQLGDTVGVRFDAFGVNLQLPIVEVKISIEQGSGDTLSVATNLLNQSVTRILRQMVQAVQPALYVGPSSQLVRYAGTGAVPTNPPVRPGFKFFDTTSNTEQAWDGTSWRTVTWV